MLDKLTSKQRAMIYMGRDEMRKRNSTGNQGNSRNVKVARIGGDDNDNETGSQMDASDITMQPGSNNTSA